MFVVSARTNKRHHHHHLLQNYDCSDQHASAQPLRPSDTGCGTAANTDVNPQSQHAGSQDNNNGKLLLPQLNCFQEAFKRSQVAPPVSSSSQDQQQNLPTPISTQHSLTQQISTIWPQFKALCQLFAGKFHLSQKHKATKQDSVTPISEWR